MRILVVCGAGASSTFVAQRLTRAAAASGLDWSASAGVERDVAAGIADLVLLGPHLAARHDQVAAAAQAPAVTLPPDIFADLDGSRTLELVRSALAGTPTPSPRSKGNP